MNIFLPLIGVFIKVKGQENFRNGKNFIVVCNHNSLIDIPVSSPQIPGPNKTIAKMGLAKIPVFGTAYKLGSVLVDRKDKNSRKNSFNKMKKYWKWVFICVFILKERVIKPFFL